MTGSDISSERSVQKDGVRGGVVRIQSAVIYLFHCFATALSSGKGGEDLSPDLFRV